MGRATAPEPRKGNEMADIESKVRKLNKTVTLSVVITNEFRIRMRIAAALIRLAARVLGCGIEFVDDKPAPQEAK